MSDPTTATPAATNPLAGFVPVQVRALRTTRADAVDLFMQYESSDEPWLYCRAGTSPDAAQFAELATAGVENLYVRSADFASFSNDLFDSVDTLLKQPLLHSAEKFAALQL